MTPIPQVIPLHQFGSAEYCVEQAQKMNVQKTEARVESGAYISACGRYRYSLWRQWAPGLKVMFVGLNPSTADHARRAAQQQAPVARKARSTT